ncbi:guanylate kinase [Micromonospora sonchi]|uniref:guanylate kinase n=1 Tax=Micromonospora sonchi TaxID=1763543 RepID=UPI00166D2879|nr:guanylate kinase [Micromonospora sonchi]
MSLDDEARPATRLTVLVSPFGAGGESVVESVRARSPSVWTPITLTTRPRREGELDGVHRHFVAPGEFDRRVAAGELLEWSWFGAHRRGTETAPLRRRVAAGQPVLLPLDLDGALLVRSVWPEAGLVLLHPPGRLPAMAATVAFDRRLSHDRTERVISELVGFIGSSFLAPARPRPRG